MRWWWSKNKHDKEQGSFPLVWVLSDDTHRVDQALQVSNRLARRLVVCSLGDIQLAGGVSEYIKTHHLDESSPDIVMSTGRETAEAALQIKQYFHHKLLLVSMLNPCISHHDFDVIVIADYEPHPEGDNILTTVGLVNYIDTDFLQRAFQDYEEGRYGSLKAAFLPSPRVALLVGGRHAGGNVSVADAGCLSEWIEETMSGEGSVMVVTSARTPRATSDALRELLTGNVFFYDYKQDRHMVNPYDGVLALADTIIVTGDSVRMCSEACSTGKPVYIYTSPDESFSPYSELHKQLCEKGHARLLTSDGAEVDWSVSHPLNEAERVADYIRQKLDVMPRL